MLTKHWIVSVFILWSPHIGFTTLYQKVHSEVIIISINFKVCIDCCGTQTIQIHFLDAHRFTEVHRSVHVDGTKWEFVLLNM